MKPRNDSARKHGLREAVAGVAALTLLASVCFAAQPSDRPLGQQSPASKISKDIDRGRGGAIDVIVQFSVVPTSEHYQRMADRGAVVKTRLHGIRAAAFRLPASAIAKLESDPDIVYVTPDRQVHLTDYEQFEPA